MVRVVANDVILGSMWLLLARVAAAVRMNVDVRIPRFVVRDNVQESMEGGISIKVSEGRQRDCSWHDDVWRSGSMYRLGSNSVG